MWQGMWLEKVQKGMDIPSVVKSELLEQGLVHFNHTSPSESLMLSESGKTALTLFLSADYASKRY